MQPATKEGGIYQQALEFLNKAESMGLVDPDSTTQDWDTMRTKVTNGKTMLSIWSWLGKPRMNSDENKAKGVGFMLAMVMFSGVRKRVEACDPPAPFKGLPITLIAAAITSLSFMGFGGIVENLFNVTL